MSKICFVLLAILIFSLLCYCDAQNVGSGYNDGNHSNGGKSFAENFLNKARFLKNMKAPANPDEKPKFNFENDLVIIDERQGTAGITGSFIGEATSRSSSCAIASVPCSCASATGTCVCSSTTGCTCTVAPCTYGTATSGSSSSSSSGSSSGSSGSSSATSSGSSTSNSSSTSISKVCTGPTAAPACKCYTTTCVNGTCDPVVVTDNHKAPCP